MDDLHYIDADLDLQAWVETGLARLENYLARWSRFQELYPPDAP